METLWHDLRYAARTFSKKPGFTFIVIVTLALGIGVNTAIFSIVNAVLLRPLPYQGAERLTLFRALEAEQESNPFSFPDIRDLREQQQSFEQLAAIRSGGWTLAGTVEAARIPSARVSAEFFPVLGVKPVLGRVFLPEED